MRNRTKHLAAASGFAAVLLFAGLSNFASAAGLVEVTQTIFGMDCAPCAHGVQKSLMKLDGVTNATVSLTDGYARVLFEPDNTVSMERIREVVRENGFTPKQAKVVVAGILSRREGGLLLTFADQKFRLSAATDAKEALRELEETKVGVPVRIAGEIEQSDPRRILVSYVVRID